MDAGRLKTIPLFASLDKDELARLGRVTDEVDVAEGEELLREGSFAHEFMVIEDGRAEVMRESGEHVAELGPGDFFGEIAALEAGRRNATVVARSPMTLVVMTAFALRELARSIPQLDQTLRAAANERHPINRCA